MYSLDRRKLASHVYKIIPSLRKTALILQVSHTTISRWLNQPDKKQYTRSKERILKSTMIVEIVKATLQNDPFVSIYKLGKIIQETLRITVSKELLRTTISKSGYSRKKARFFGKPNNLEEITREFIHKRNEFIRQNRLIVSLDETSFGRNGCASFGYSLKGQKLFIDKKIPRMTTTSVLSVVSSKGIIANTKLEGSFNTENFKRFLEFLQLPEKTVILLDNVKFHHSKVCKDVAYSKGFELLFVPPYSPWFNPIEGIFSIVKREFYKGLTIEESFDKITEKHCSAFFQKSLNAFERW